MSINVSCSESFVLKDYSIRAKKAGIADIRELLAGGILSILQMLGETVDIYPDNGTPIAGINALVRSPKKEEIALFKSVYDTKDSLVFELPRLGGCIDLSVIKPHGYTIKYGNKYYEIEEIGKDDAETSIDGRIDSAVVILYCTRMSGRVGEIT